MPIKVLNPELDVRLKFISFTFSSYGEIKPLKLSLLLLFNNDRKGNHLPVHSKIISVSSVTQSCMTLCDPMDCNTPGFPVHHQLPEFTQTHVRQVDDALQPSHSLSAPSPPASNLSQHRGLFQWVSSSHQVVKVLEFQLQHQSFQWTFRTDFL